MSFSPNPQPSKGRSRYPRWTLRDGTKVRVEDLSDKHLANTIRYLRRTARERYPEFCAQALAAYGMDIAPDMEESAYSAAMEDDHWEVCLHPMYEHLIAEAKRRGLEIDHEQS